MGMGQRIMQWWDWHRTAIFGVVAIFPVIWLQHPELQALMPPKAVSIAGSVIGALGFISEFHKKLTTVTFPKPKP